MPREVSDEGLGLYDDSVITIVKELSSEGVDAKYLHEKEQRTWIGEYAAETLILDLVIGIASSAGWSALCRVLSGRHRDGRFRKSGSETSVDWLSASGPGEQVAEALAALETARDGKEEEKAPKQIEE